MLAFLFGFTEYSSQQVYQVKQIKKQEYKGTSVEDQRYP